MRRESSNCENSPSESAPAREIKRMPAVKPPFRTKGWGMAVPGLQASLKFTWQAPPREVRPYFTTRLKLSEWLLNSGAYMHWMLATPVWYWPRNWTRVAYSNT